MSNRRGRGAPEGEQPEIVPTAGTAARRQRESGGGAGPPESPGEPCSPLATEAQLAVSTPGSSTRWREEDPHLRVALSSVLSFFFSFIERGLRFIRNNSHFCAEQAPYSCAWRAPPRRGFRPCRLRPRSHAASVLEGFHLKKIRCLGFSVCFLKIISKEY